MLQVRGREMSREEFRKNFVGVEPFRMVEIVQDNPEADTATNWQNVGKTAVNDQWDKQIYGLQDQVKDLTARLDAAVKDGDAWKANAANLQQQITDLSTKFDELLKVNNIKDAQIKDLTAKLSVQSNDTQLLNSFGEWLQKLIARLGVKKG